MAIQVKVQVEDFDVARAYQSIREAGGAKVGAIAAFVGLVRDRNEKAGDGSKVSTLTLEHYPGMTEKSIESIAEKAISRWPLLDLHVYHRVGRLAPTEQIVLVLASSAHRDAAFAGAEFVMDYLKTDAVFWKKESTEEGDHWIQSTSSDHARATEWDKTNRRD